MNLLADLLASDDAQLPARLPGGAQVARLAAAVWQITPPTAAAGRALIVSAGIHGDETAPVEVLCGLVSALCSGALVPRVPLLLVFGNLQALRAARRYLDDDLNRLFGSASVSSLREAPRAAALAAAVDAFCAQHAGPLHLDLHSAIRDSRYACFAIAPRKDSGPLGGAPQVLLAACGIEAVLLTGAAAPTFSARSARLHGCEAYTFELGRVRRLGDGVAGEFAAAERVLRALIAAEPMPEPVAQLRVFRVSRELIKHSDAFRLTLPADAANFTGFEPGALIAEDGPLQWHAEAGELIVFPNPVVKPGLRAGLMVVADPASDV
ncbi:succinylglutamate desuccinylase [Niveibacterium sp.]|uniref:succinylglutamate desuccinylase n=1 Tax=Niveibacterium sp. TaxID=2017444 RepID=UPI0035B46682